MTVTVDRTVEEFTAAPQKLFINGQWTDAASGRTFATPNPATGETLANVAEGDAEDINRAVRAARQAFDDSPWARMTLFDRGRLIWKIGDLILEHADEFGIDNSCALEAFINYRIWCNRRTEELGSNRRHGLRFARFFLALARHGCRSADADRRLSVT